MQMNRCCKLFAFFWFALSLASATADEYPNRPVRLIVGFSAGGNADTPTRIVANKLGELWGSSIVVENRPGAGGNIAADIAAKASPDGYTLILCNSASHAINPALYKKITFDPIKDFAAISQIGSSPNVLLIHASVQATTVSEFIAIAKANPGKISVGSAGVGTSQHLSLEMLKFLTGADLLHVPYKGGIPALSDLLGGQIPAMVAGIPTALPALKGGKVRALGVTSATRSPQLPTLAAIGESVPGFDVTSWLGLCAPSGVSETILTKLNTDLVTVLNMPDIRERLAEHGIDAMPTTREQFDTFIKTEIVKWAKIIKEARLTSD
ncbi:MAG: tripartite tricarboxylate transporter substrate binding protein [Alcaligenaceae bacterium]